MAAIAAPGSLAEMVRLRSQFRDGKKALIDHFMGARATVPAAARLVRALTRHVDATLNTLWRQAQLADSAALAGVGGYGRGELFPYSDVEVLVLLPDDAGAAVRDQAGRFVTACWDIGLEIGPSVATVAECVADARADLTVQTAMLESRWLAGSKP